MTEFVSGLSESSYLSSIFRLKESIVSIRIAPIVSFPSVKTDDIQDSMLPISPADGIHNNFINTSFQIDHDNYKKDGDINIILIHFPIGPVSEQFSEFPC